MAPFSSLRHFTAFQNTFLKAGALITWFPMALFFNDHVAQLMWVTGPSMYPFLNTDYNSTTRKDVVLTDMRQPWEDLKRGMVVALWSPYHPENMIVKRIVAVEGDHVQTRQPYPFPTAQVPVGHVWVEGDHPEDKKTLDSNTYGPVAKSLIVGKVKAVVWPWSKTGFIRWQDYRGSSRVMERQHDYDSGRSPELH